MLKKYKSKYTLKFIDTNKEYIEFMCFKRINGLSLKDTLNEIAIRLKSYLASEFVDYTSIIKDEPYNEVFINEGAKCQIISAIYNGANYFNSIKKLNKYIKFEQEWKLYKINPEE